MSKKVDQKELLTRQYRDASNLNARIRLHRLFSTNKYGWLRWVFDQFQFESPCRILEIGCGPAVLWVENQDRIPPDWEITLSDFSPGMIEEARQNLAQCGHPFTFRVMDAQSLNIADQTFDVVIANHMLYHVPDKAKALAEIRRVLKPGGHFYAATNGETDKQKIHEILVRFAPEHIPAAHMMGSPFTLENGTAQLAPFFTDIQIHRYPDSFEITEAQPLINFMASISPAIGECAALVQHIQQEIKTHGVIEIHKDSGLFVAIPGYD